MMDQTDKMKNILCSQHSKKIQFINVGPETSHLFICSDCLKKNKTFCMDNMNSFVSLEEFKHEFLKKLTKDMEVLKSTLHNQTDHIISKSKEATMRIEEDFDNITTALQQYIKFQMNAYKSVYTKRITDLNNKNTRALSSLIQKLALMVSSSKDLSTELHSALVTSLDDTGRLQKIITSRVISPRPPQQQTRVRRKRQRHEAAVEFLQRERHRVRVRAGQTKVQRTRLATQGTTRTRSGGCAGQRRVPR